MGNSDSASPSRAWYILPGLLALAAVLIAGIGISSFVHFARSDFRAYQPDTSIPVTRDGLTVYAEDGTGAADLRCTATGADGMVQLRRVAGRTALRNSSGSFVAIASTPRDLQTGHYVISCAGASAGADVPLFLGPRLDLAAVGRLVAFAIIAPLFLGVCSVVLFAILAVLRYRSRRIATATD